MKVLQHPRGSTGVNDAFTGAEAQLTVDVSRWELRLHDGVTPGGHRILNLEQLILLFMLKDSEFGEVAFGESELGYLVRVGDRQYELREIEGDEGIIVEEGLATAGNTVVKIDPEWLANYVKNLFAAGINFVVTEGSENAYTATLPEDYPQDTDGALFGVEFHTGITSTSATLSVNGEAGKWLRLAGGSYDLPDAVRTGCRALIMTVAGEFIIIGLQKALEVPIDPISGLTATNVQEALEELYALITGGGGDAGLPIGWMYTFGSLTQLIGNPYDRFNALTEGQAIFMDGAIPYSSGTGGPQENPPVPQSMKIFHMVVRFNGELFAGKIVDHGFNTSSNDNFAQNYDAAGIYQLPPILLPVATFFHPSRTVSCQASGPTDPLTVADA